MEIPKANSFLVKKIIDKYVESENFTIKFSNSESFDMTKVIIEYISSEEREILKRKLIEATFGFTLIFE